MALQVIVNKCLRRILRIFWRDRISNEELWRRTNQTPSDDTEIRKHKREWLGHTLRKPENNIPRMALEWNPQGSRARSRPKATWRRTILSETRKMNKSWQEVKMLARNKVRWRNFVEALCSAME